MNQLMYKKTQTVVFILTLVVLSFALYVEYIEHVNPCPLCLMQRLCVLCLVPLCLISFFIQRYRTSVILVLMQLFMALSGLFFAGRQVFLQNVAITASGMCMPTLHRVIKYLSWEAMFNLFFWGSSDCAEMTPHFLGLSMPLWSALYFILIVLLFALILVKLKRSD